MRWGEGGRRGRIVDADEIKAYVHRAHPCLAENSLFFSERDTVFNTVNTFILRKCLEIAGSSQWEELLQPQNR